MRAKGWWCLHLERSKNLRCLRTLPCYKHLPKMESAYSMNDSRLCVDVVGGNRSCRSEMGPWPVVTGIGNSEKQHNGNQHGSMLALPGPGMTSCWEAQTLLGQELITTKEGERSGPGGYSINPSPQIQYRAFILSCV